MDNRVKLHDKYFKSYISHETLIKAVDEVAAKINADYKGSGKTPVVLCVLSGSIVFSGYLLTRLEFPCELAAIKVTSYEGTRSTGNIKEVLGLGPQKPDNVARTGESVIRQFHHKWHCLAFK